VTVEEIKVIIENQIGVLLYFSGEDCSVCKALRPKFKELFDKEFPQVRQLYLDALEYSEVATHFQVFTVPTMIVFLDGKEFVREGRAVSLQKMSERLGRPYGMITQL